MGHLFLIGKDCCHYVVSPVPFPCFITFNLYSVENYSCIEMYLNHIVNLFYFL